MKHFYRTQLSIADVLAEADVFFPGLGLNATTNAPKSRTYVGPLGALNLSVFADGGHYTFVEADTDQAGESRLDRNVKKFFVQLHRRADPTHALEAAY